MGSVFPEIYPDESRLFTTTIARSISSSVL